MTPAARLRPTTPAPRWAVRTAHIVPLCVLPSGLWRIALVAGVAGYHGRLKPWEGPYILSLTVVSEALALLTFGLVRPWGEVVPGRIPFLGGRRIPVMAAVIPAALGAFAVTAIWTFATVNSPNLADGSMGLRGAALWAVYACYAPLLAWGPLLALVTAAYYRRRRRAARPSPIPASSSPGPLPGTHARH
jgi:hypothetical protein